jgi:hypothetical protein
MIKLSVLKNRLSGILSFGYLNISVVPGILSVVGIPPVHIPIPEEIQLLIYGSNRIMKNIKKCNNSSRTFSTKVRSGTVRYEKSSRVSMYLVQLFSSIEANRIQSKFFNILTHVYSVRPKKPRERF